VRKFIIVKYGITLTATTRPYTWVANAVTNPVSEISSKNGSHEMFTSNTQNKLHTLNMNKWWSHLTKNERYSFYLYSYHVQFCSNNQPKRAETTDLPTTHHANNDAWVHCAILTYVRSSYFHRDGSLKIRMNGRTSIPCFAVTTPVQRIDPRISKVVLVENDCNPYGS
jgi:hypothetical protein